MGTSVLRAVLARLTMAASDTGDQQRVLDQQKVIDAIQQRLDIAPEQNQNEIKEELLKAKDTLSDIKKNQDLKSGGDTDSGA